MKRTALRILTFLSFAALFLAGADALFDSTDVAKWLFGAQTEWPTLRHLEPWWLSVLIAGAMMLLPLLAIAAWLLGGRDDAIETTTRDGNRIRVSPGAVERIVNREVRSNVVEVVKVGCSARQGSRGHATLLVRVAVSDRAPVPEIERRVKAETLKVLNHLLGGSDERQIRVLVHDIQGARIKAGSEAKAALPAPRKRRRPRPEAVESADEDV